MAVKTNCIDCGVEYYDTTGNICPRCKSKRHNAKSLDRFNRTKHQTYKRSEHLDKDTLSPSRVVRLEKKWGRCESGISGHGGEQQLYRTQSTHGKFLCDICLFLTVAMDK